MTTFTLHVGNHVDVHPSREAALAALRINYADGDDVSDDALLDFVRGQGITPVEITENPADSPLDADPAITITRASLESMLGRSFTDAQWNIFRSHALDAVLPDLYDLGRQIIAYGRPGQGLSADSAEIGDIILDQNGDGPYEVVDAEMPPSSYYLRFTFRRVDGTEFTDTAAMEAQFLCVGGPSYLDPGSQGPPILPGVTALIDTERNPS